MIVPLLLALVASILSASGAPSNTCTCPSGFPSLPPGGFQKIQGFGGCILNYVQFFDNTGAVVFASGTPSSGGEPFSVACPGSATITGFSYLCDIGSGPDGAFPSPPYATFSTLGGIVCSDGSAAVYTGSHATGANENICDLANGFTQIGFLDCGADGTAPQTCFNENGVCLQHGQQPPCAGTQSCSIGPSPPGPSPPPPPPSGSSWSQSAHDAQHSARSNGILPQSKPAISWTRQLTESQGQKPLVLINDTLYVGDFGGPSSAVYGLTASSGVAIMNISLPAAAGMDLAILSDGSIFCLLAAPATGAGTAYRISSSGAIMWQTALGESVGGLTVSSSAAYMPVVDSNQPYAAGYMMALDLSTGSVLFKSSSGGGYVNAPAYSPADGLLYAGTYTAPFTAISATDGTIKWQDGNEPLEWWGSAVVSTVTSGVMYVPAPQNYGPQGQSIIAHDSATGAILWATKNPFGNEVAARPQTISETLSGALVIRDALGNVFSVDASGKILWTYAQPDPWGDPLNSAKENPDALLTDSSGSTLFSHNSTLIAFTPTGSILWQTALPYDAPFQVRKVVARST